MLQKQNRAREAQHGCHASNLDGRCVMKILYALHQYYPEYQAGTEKFVYNMASMSELNANKVKIVTYRLGDFNHPVKSADGF